MIQDAFRKLDRYCRSSDYRGWDLFDGLNSHIFRKSRLAESRFLRLAWIQLFKRCPINLRKITGVPKGINPKGLALFASGLVHYGRPDEARRLLDALAAMQCLDFAGNSWGYNFPWQARAFYVPIGTPNMVTTVFAASAFLDYYEKNGNSCFLDMAIPCRDFILQHLVLHEDEQTLCFGYIPGEQAMVHNVNMLGAALLARIYKHTGDAGCLEKSTKAMRYSINAMNHDFSWPYGERSHHRFIDNFHTGYNLVALHRWTQDTGDNRWQRELAGAYRYFIDTFWLDDGRPKYYHDRLFPIDIHCSAQGIVTCLKLADFDEQSLGMAEAIAKWAITNMQDPSGYFYYQKKRWHTNKIPYIRWSQAWMFYALSLLNHQISCNS